MPNTYTRDPYAVNVGDRLRKLRVQRGLSLAKVEEMSRGKHKAIVVGSYERADRAMTVTRMAELAAFYGVDPADLLPGERATPAGLDVIDEVQRTLARLSARVPQPRADVEPDRIAS